MTRVARIMTIGHSTRTAEDFIRLLNRHEVRGLADIRTIPKSRRHPHFSREALHTSLPAAGIVYRHLPGLGGLRQPRRNSRNGGWRHDAFRGYADHMETPEFTEAFEALLAFAEERLVAIMCAEAKWWQCHRQLVADALVARGIDVRHILSLNEAPPHELTSFARVEEGHVTYPALV